MNDILLLNKIASAGTSLFNKEKYNLTTECEEPDGILVRSASMLDMEFSASLEAIARAGAGVNNIPIDECSKEGIVVFNTPGANANGVKELTIAALLISARDVVGGSKWTDTLKDIGDVAAKVEKGKSAFGGIELVGKTLGVIGLGAIGGMVANACVSSSFGMNVIGYDPYISVDAAWNISRSVKRASGYDEIFEKSDFITVHVPLTPETKNMFCKANFAKMKDGVRIVNLSRAGLVNSDDMKEALADGKVARYVCDFPTDDTVAVPGIVTIPHLGASTEESEENCAAMAALQLIDYIENGNIKNSVNFPSIYLERGDMKRICVLHYNIPAVISKISAAFADMEINIEHLSNRSKGDYAYTMVDVSIDEIPDEAIEKIAATDGVIRINIKG